MKFTILFPRKLTATHVNKFYLKNVIIRAASTAITDGDTELNNKTKKLIESHWRDSINLQNYDETDNTRRKFYVLSMFPYPSGALHMGHIRVYTISDTVARFYRMQGYNVLHPIGWDAFGLPAENAAIDSGIHPTEWTTKNISDMKSQLKDMNFSFDWDREISTCDPNYYKWTQELFLKLYDSGLIYQKEAFVNWDPVDQTVLADEQVDENNCSWRSGAKIEKKLLNQWFIRTTPFAKSLFDGLQDPTLKNWRDVVKMQQHWIGACTGTSFELQLMSDIENCPKSINVWTSAPAFIEYAKFVAISPKSTLNLASQSQDVSPGIKQLRATVINPFNGNELPVYITDEVTYPDFRETYVGIPYISEEAMQFCKTVDIPLEAHNISSMDEKSKQQEILSKAMEWKIGGYPVSPRLQDWPISRQRYWGTPIPIIHCRKCGVQPVPRDQLPVVLPGIEFSSSSKSVTLKNNKTWISTTCPKCKEPAEREADTMDTFVDSSWYYLRYVDPKNTSDMFSTDKLNRMFPVDLYIGGKEHGVLHLYYARFISHYLHSQGLLPSKEPFTELLIQGMVMGKTYQLQSTGKYLKPSEVDETAEGCKEKSTGESVTVSWEKMSKSKHNGVNPVELLDMYGIDTTRLLILADVTPTSDRKWSTETLTGVCNWQDKIWSITKKFVKYRKHITLTELKGMDVSEKFEKDDAYMFDSRNFFLKAVTRSLKESQQISIAISRMQGLTNALMKVSSNCIIKSRHFERALAAQIIMLAPLTPHFASELWSLYCSANHHLTYENEIDINKDVMEQKWPDIDPDYNMMLKVVMNGKQLVQKKMPKHQLENLTADEALNLVKDDPQFQKKMKDRSIVCVTLCSKGNCDGHLEIRSRRNVIPVTSNT